MKWLSARAPGGSREPTQGCYRSKNQDFVPNSEFLPKMFWFVPIFRTHFKIDSKWCSKPKNVLNLFWILSLLVFSTIKCNLYIIQKMFWICTEIYTLWIFQLGNKNVCQNQKMLWICPKFYPFQWCSEYKKYPSNSPEPTLPIPHNPEGTAEGPWCCYCSYCTRVHTWENQEKK